MTERVLSVSVKLKADGSGLIGQVRAAKAEVVALGEATAAAGAKAIVLAAGTVEATAAARGLAREGGQAGAAAATLGAATGQADAAARELADGIGQATAAATTLGGAARGAAGDVAAIGAVQVGREIDAQLTGAGAAAAALGTEARSAAVDLAAIGAGDAGREVAAQLGVAGTAAVVLGAEARDAAVDVAAIGTVQVGRAVAAQLGTAGAAAGALGREARTAAGDIAAIGAGAARDLPAELGRAGAAVDALGSEARAASAGVASIEAGAGARELAVTLGAASAAAALLDSQARQLGATLAAIGADADAVRAQLAGLGGTAAALDAITRQATAAAAAIGAIGAAAASTVAAIGSMQVGREIAAQLSGAGAAAAALGVEARSAAVDLATIGTGAAGGEVAAQLGVAGAAAVALGAEARSAGGDLAAIGAVQVGRAVATQLGTAGAAAGALGREARTAAGDIAAIGAGAARDLPAELGRAGAAVDALGSEARAASAGVASIEAGAGARELAVTLGAASAAAALLDSQARQLGATLAAIGADADAVRAQLAGLGGTAAALDAITRQATAAATAIGVIGTAAASTVASIGSMQVGRDLAAQLGLAGTAAAALGAEARSTAGDVAAIGTVQVGREVAAQLGTAGAAAGALGREARTAAGDIAAIGAGAARDLPAELGRAGAAVDALGSEARAAGAGVASIEAGVGARELAGTFGAASAAAALLDSQARQLGATLAAIGADAEAVRAQLAGLGGTAAALDAITRQATAAGAALEGIGTAAATGTRDLPARMQQGSAAAGSYASDLARLRAEIDPVGEAERRMAAAVDLADTALARGDLTIEQHAAALARAAAAGRGQVSSLGQQRQSMIQLGQQFQDFSVQVGSGQSVATAFAQQIGQAAFAVQGMGGKMAGVATFLGGPWGIALTIALTALAPLVGKLFEGGDAADKLGDKSLSLEDALDGVRTGTDAARKALEDYNAEKDKAAGKDSLATQNALGLARANLAKAVSTRERLKALLERQYAEAGGARYTGGGALLPAAAATQGAIEEQEGQIQLLRRTLTNLSVDFSRDLAKTAADPTAALNRDFDELADRISRAATASKGFADSLALQNKLTKDLAANEIKRAAALKTLQDTQRQAASQARSDARAGTLTPFLSPVAGGRITGSFGDQRSDHVHAGVDYAVPVGTPVRAPAAGTVDVAGPRQGYGNAIYINFGGGTSARFGHLAKFNVQPGDRVEAGDIIGYSGGAAGAPGSGDSTGPHLHYEVRQGKTAVDPTKGAYRTDAGAASDDAQRLADQAASKAATLQRQAEEAAKTLAAFGEQASGQIAAINAQFSEQPTLIQRSAEATAKLDGILRDLEKRKPPGFEAMIVQARQAQAAAADVDRPFRDYIEAQQQSLQIGQLTLAGQDDQADALRTILDLERQRGPLTEAQKDAVLATTQALRAQGQEIERNRQRQQLYLGAVDDVRQIVTQTIYEGPASLKDLPGRLFDSFKKFNAELITENLFGDTFRKLKADITGQTGVADASARTVSAFDQMSGKIRTTGDAIDALGEVSRRVAAGLSGAPAGSATSAATSWYAPPEVDDAPIVSGLLGSLSPALGAIAGATGDLSDAASGFRQVDDGTPGTPGSGVPTPFDRLVPQITTLSASIKWLSASIAAPQPTPQSQPDAKRPSAADAYGHQITELIKKVGINDQAASTIGKIAGKGLAGAFEGQAAAGVASLLGIKTSSTGAAIGGAIGSVIPIPGGSIIGGLLGGIVGGLFQKPKYGTASVISGDAAAATSGSNAEYIGQAAGLAGSVQDGLHQIADQLGGMLGDFSVAIGTFDGKYRVNTSATGASLNYNNFSDATLKNFGDDQGAAISFAIADAIRDGAVKGLSQAQQLALQSSDDLDKAVNEAIKVGQLELDLSGVQGQIDKLFKDFDRTAAERVDLAKKYGLDLLAVEKLNADQRADLIEKTLSDRVSGLKDLLSNIQYGDLFEGSATERRSAILGEIADAKDDADAGVEGAADRLAQLYRTLVETSKDAFGTAGSEYGDDRATAIAGIDRAIQLESDRVNAGATNDQTAAIETGNTLTSESNDLLAQLGSLTQAQTATLEAMLGAMRGGFAPNLALVSR